MFIFSTAIALGVWMTRKVSNYHLGVKGQGQFIKNLYYDSSFILIEGVYIWHNDNLWCVDYNTSF